jgi:hypothetical protein
MGKDARSALASARAGLKSVHLGGPAEVSGLPPADMDRREELARRAEIGDWPDFVDHPHFHSARRRLPPDAVPAPKAERAGFCWAEFVATFVAGFAAGALFLLILAWRVAP